jgi:hypothetical protein
VAGDDGETIAVEAPSAPVPEAVLGLAESRVRAPAKAVEPIFNLEMKGS